MPNEILIRNGRVIDPASGRDEAADVAIAAGRIVAIGNVPADFTPERTIEADGCVVAPGLVDLAARLKEPGPGALESELEAAAAGGVTSLVCPPDMDPPLDEPGLVDMLKFRARKLSRCRLFPLGALTQRLAGEELTEMIDLTEAGCVGFSQAEHPIKDNLTLMRAMQYASTRGYAVWLRPQDRRCPAAWPPAARWRRGWACRACRWPPRRSRCTPSSSWCARPARACTSAGCRAPRASSWCARAKAEGLPVTADVSINSLHLTDVDIGYFNADMRLTPPLRQGKDRDALRAGLADGTIDALVSDHTPIGDDDKMLPFGEAVPGATGLELLLSLALKWGDEVEAHARAGARARDERAGARAGRGARLAGPERGAAGRGRRRRHLRVRPRRRMAGHARDAAQPGQAHAVRRRLQRHAHARPRAPHAGGRHPRLQRRPRTPPPLENRSSRSGASCASSAWWRAGCGSRALVMPRRDAAGRRAIVQRWSAADAAPPGRGGAGVGHARIRGRRADGGQPRVVAGHPRAARERAAGALRVEGGHRALAAAGPAGARRRHAVHRARAQARRAARGARGRRGAAPGRRRRRLPRRHDRRRPRRAAVPRQPAAGRHHHGHGRAARRAALPRARPGGERGRPVHRRHDAGRQPDEGLPGARPGRRRAFPAGRARRASSTAASLAQRLHDRIADESARR